MAFADQFLRMKESTTSQKPLYNGSRGVYFFTPFHRSEFACMFVPVSPPMPNSYSCPQSMNCPGQCFLSAANTLLQYQPLLCGIMAAGWLSAGWFWITHTHWIIRLFKFWLIIWSINYNCTLYVPSNLHIPLQCCNLWMDCTIFFLVLMV